MSRVVVPLVTADALGFISVLAPVVELVLAVAFIKDVVEFAEARKTFGGFAAVRLIAKTIPLAQ